MGVKKFPLPKVHSPDYILPASSNAHYDDKQLQEALSSGCAELMGIMVSQLFSSLPSSSLEQVRAVCIEGLWI